MSSSIAAFVIDPAVKIRIATLLNMRNRCGPHLPLASGRYVDISTRVHDLALLFAFMDDPTTKDMFPRTIQWGDVLAIANDWYMPLPQMTPTGFGKMRYTLSVAARIGCLGDKSRYVYDTTFGYRTSALLETQKDPAAALVWGLPENVPTLIYDFSDHQLHIDTFADWKNEREEEEEDDTETIIEYVNRRFGTYGGVVDYEELDDGTVVVAVPDPDFDPHGSSDDPETERALIRAAEEGDVFGIIRVDRDAHEIDSVWGMAGYGGADKAIKAYIEDYGPTPHKRALTPDEERARAHPPTTVAPTAQPSVTDPLTPDEANAVDWMLRMGWYSEYTDAVKHILRMRKAGLKPTLQGLTRSKLMSLPSWGG